MKLRIITAALLCLSPLAFSADQDYPRNVVERPSTLAKGDIQVSGFVGYGKETDGDKKAVLSPSISYGVTDDFTIGLGHARYRLISRSGNGTGFELSTGLSYVGAFEIEGADDSHGAGFDLSGKYVVSKDTAFTFSTQYVRWFEDETETLIDDRSEIRYSVGIQQNIVENFTAFANYTYSDLKDFNESSAQSGSIGLNYAYSNTMDIGMAASYSDFDAQENNIKPEGIFEQGIGAYLVKRF